MFRDSATEGTSAFPSRREGGHRERGRGGDFRRDVCNVLLATSVAARAGWKRARARCHYDTPNHLEDYVQGFI